VGPADRDDRQVRRRRATGQRRSVIASFLLLGGLALLSVVTATITSGFVARAQRESRSDGEADVLAETRALRAQVDELAERLER